MCAMDTLGAQEMTYEPGDHLGIFPANPTDFVNIMLSHTDLESILDPDDLFSPEKAEENQESHGLFFEQLPTVYHVPVVYIM